MFISQQLCDKSLNGGTCDTVSMNQKFEHFLITDLFRDSVILSQKYKFFFADSSEEGTTSGFMQQMEALSSVELFLWTLGPNVFAGYWMKATASFYPY